MAPHVLVADDDAWILRMVATVLEKRGYSVETAVDGEDALQRALARTPDLLITDVMMPKLDGWALVRQLRAHAELAMLPVIFLTALSAEDDRIRGFRLGADDYVTKPFRFEELDLRVAKTLRRAQQAQVDTREQLATSGLRGDLSQVGLSSLLVLIEMERKTGLLQLRAPNGPSGQILVRDGKVVHARLDEQEDPVDAECVYYMLTWGAGEFEFIACVVEGTDRVNVSTTHLLMEGARLMDEANEPSAQTSGSIRIPAKVDSDAAKGYVDPFAEPSGVTPTPLLPPTSPVVDAPTAHREPDEALLRASSPTLGPPVRQSDPGLRPSEPGVRTKTEPGVGPSQPAPRAGDAGLRSSESSLRAAESGRSSESSLRAAESGLRPSESSLRAGEPSSRPSDADLRTNDANVRASEPALRPGESSARPKSEPPVRPSDPGARPSDPALRANREQPTRSSDSASDAGRRDSGSRPGDSASDAGGRPSDSGTRPGDSSLRAGEPGTRAKSQPAARGTEPPGSPNVDAPTTRGEIDEPSPSASQPFSKPPVDGVVDDDSPADDGWD